MPGFSLLRGNSYVAGHATLNNPYGVDEGDPVGIFIGLQRGNCQCITVFVPTSCIAGPASLLTSKNARLLLQAHLV